MLIKQRSNELIQSMHCMICCCDCIHFFRGTNVLHLVSVIDSVNMLTVQDMLHVELIKTDFIRCICLFKIPSLLLIVEINS